MVRFCLVVIHISYAMQLEKVVVTIGHCVCRKDVLMNRIVPGQAIKVTADIAHKYNNQIGVFVSYPFGDKEISVDPTKAWVMCYHE